VARLLSNFCAVFCARRSVVAALGAWLWGIVMGRSEWLASSAMCGCVAQMGKLSAGKTCVIAWLVFGW
jgi:hypothetical protein